MTHSSKGASAPVSFASLSAVDAGGVPFKMPYKPGNRNLGIIIHVLGNQSKTVQAALNANINEQRKSAIARAAVGATDPEFVPVETTEETNWRLCATRISGWDGIDQDYSPQLAYELVKSNQDIYLAVLRASTDVSNFLKPSSAD